ncbi:virion structural protein [Pectobacterium phage vB_PcaM_CBB]|uniref:Structural protein n=1 Tax=Pectobacterium phage vB_PcaM_CBB TaxID=2772511 RepID=A0A1L2CUY6_9CAUD|nr:virion structural protein [Pectobacterium phage vB_PcaM_CBB]AMM43850.1 structural protein [Pectobacterium phage vB_PcaM_CBB]
MIHGMYSNNNDDQFEQKSDVLKNAAESKLSMIQRGSVTEITMGDRTFQVTDPKRMEQTISVLKHQEEAIQNLRARMKEHHNAISVLVQEIQTLKNEVQRLKEITNGYGSQEFSNY